MTRIKHTTFTVLILLTSALQSYSQGWVGNGGNNLNAVNSTLAPTPISIGIGTNAPTAQLHTTGTLRHENLTVANQLNRILVTDPSGNVFWRNAATIGTANAWLLNGNAGTSAATNFLGTTDNNAVVVRSNNIERMRVNVGTFRGVDIGTPNINNELRIYGRDSVGFVIPLIISGNIGNQTFGNSISQTMGRLMRLNQVSSANSTFVNFYDMGIGQDTCFFITNHSVPPSFGNGVIRKRMIVISPQDRVGINLSGDAIGNGAVPTANLHTDGTVRFQNLPGGSGNILVIDAQGNIFRSSGVAAKPSTNTEIEINKLRKEIEMLKKMIGAQAKIPKEVDIPVLHQNSPNPYDQSTQIRFYLPADIKSASIIIADMSGKQLRLLHINTRGNGSISFDSGNLTSGIYLYSLVTESGIADTKQMAIMR